MSAKLIYDNAEEIPENLRPRATRTANGFELDATPLLENHAQLAKETQRFRSAAEKLKAYGDIQPEDARRAILEMEKFQQADRDAEKAVRDAVNQANERHHRERDSLLSYIKETTIANAIVAAGGNPVLLTPHVSSAVRAELQEGKVTLRVIDSSGHIRVDSATAKPMELGALINRLKSDQNFKGAFSGTDAGTNASKPSSPPSNYFQPEQRTITLTREQARNPRIYREAVKKVGHENIIVEQLQL